MITIQFTHSSIRINESDPLFGIVARCITRFSISKLAYMNFMKFCDHFNTKIWENHYDWNCMHKSPSYYGALRLNRRTLQFCYSSLCINESDQRFGIIARCMTRFSISKLSFMIKLSLYHKNLENRYDWNRMYKSPSYYGA